MTSGADWVAVITAACGDNAEATTNKYAYVHDTGEVMDIAAEFLQELADEGWCREPWLLLIELYRNSDAGLAEMCSRHCGDDEAITYDLGGDVCAPHC